RGRRVHEEQVDVLLARDPHEVGSRELARERRRPSRHATGAQEFPSLAGERARRTELFGRPDQLGKDQLARWALSEWLGDRDEIVESGWIDGGGGNRPRGGCPRPRARA